MKVEKREVCRTDANCELRYGDSSWGTGKSFKYGWFTKSGTLARGGEFPAEALPQLIEFAVRCGYQLKF